MKRTLFTLTAVLASAMSFAQVTANVGGEQMQKVKKLTAPSKLMTLRSAQSGPMKSAADGVYYSRPTGTYYHGFDKEGMGYYPVILVVPPYQDVKFTNMSTDKASSQWFLNAETGMLDASDMVDGDYNLVFSGGIQAGYMMPEPVLQVGTKTYKPENRYGDYAGNVSTMGEPAPLTLADGHISSPQLGWGILSTYYLIGNGTYTDPEMGTLTSIGVTQDFEKPISPLYVEDIFFNCVSGNGDQTPLENGAELTLTITNKAGEVIATLTAGADDVVSDGEAPQTDQYFGTSYGWNVTFTQKTRDPLSGQMVPEPFVIDEAFNITITGFDNPDVNIGFPLYNCTAEDPLPDAGVLFTDGSEVYSLRYNGNLALAATFTGFFDYVEVPAQLSFESIGDVDNCNVLRISQDGASCAMENAAQQPFVYVYTAADWTDADENEVYYYEVADASDGTGEWVTSYMYDNSAWVDYGYTALAFTADACPDGEGRWAVVNITSGRGASSPVILLQGTATLDDVTTGIENAVVDNAADKGFNPNAPVYNLNGQRVSKSAKGILIQDGRKFIRK